MAGIGIPDPRKANFTVELKVILDGIEEETLLANLSKPGSGRAPCGLAAGGGAHHGYVGRLPPRAWVGQHTLEVFAVNPAPNARSENATRILLRSQKVCDGVTCKHDVGSMEKEEELELENEAVQPGGVGPSAWSQIQMMRAML
eukprot:COSAG05_NODE_339_length_11118_cov_3.752246_7_plen_144_part_00